MLETDFLEQEDKRDGDATTLYLDHKSSGAGPTSLLSQNSWGKGD